jgi:hypothetical protein
VSHAAAREEPPQTQAQLLDELTDGYAYALALDAECVRLLRRITALVADGVEPSADELGRLSRRLRDAQRELAELRRRLTELRVEAFREGNTLRRMPEAGMTGATSNVRRLAG